MDPGNNLNFYPAQSSGAIAIGSQSAQTLQGQNSVAVGYRSGQTRQGRAAVSIGEDAGFVTQGANAISIGSAAGGDNQGANSISMGLSAGRDRQGNISVAIGTYAGQSTQGPASVAMGFSAGRYSQGNSSVALGEEAGYTTQGQNSIAIGRSAGQSSQGNAAIAMGWAAAQTTQGTAAVAIGEDAGRYYQGEYSIAIGYQAGYNTQGNNSIVLNASGDQINGITANSFTVTPVRNDTSNIAEVMFYNTASKEITYGNTISVAGNITGGNVLTGGLISATGNVSGSNLNVTGQIVSTASGNAATGAGQIYLNGATNNRIDFNTNGTGAPATTTRSDGTKLLLYPTLTGSLVDYALGIDSATMWSSVPENSAGFNFKWYGATTQVASLSGTGVFSAAGNITGGNIVTSGNITTAGAGGDIVLTGGNITGAGNISATGNITAANFFGNGNTLSNVATQVTSSWTLSAGTNTVSIAVPLNGTYSIWVRGNIPNGIITYTATVVVTNPNVPVLGSSYGWYYAAGNALVLTSIPTQIVGTVNNISNAVIVTTTANVFTFGITNNSGNSAVVNYGYTKL